MYKLDRKTSVVFNAAAEELKIVLDLMGYDHAEAERVVSVEGIGTILEDKRSAAKRIAEIDDLGKGVGTEPPISTATSIPSSPAPPPPSSPSSPSSPNSSPSTSASDAIQDSAATTGKEPDQVQ